MSKLLANTLAKMIFLLLLLNSLLFWARHYVKEKTGHLEGFRMFIVMPFSLYMQHVDAIENVLSDQHGKLYSIKEGPNGVVLLAFPDFSLYANSLTVLSADLQTYYSFRDYHHQVYGKAILIVGLLMIAALSFVTLWQPTGGLTLEVKTFK